MQRDSVAGMPGFLVETYLPRRRSHELAARERSARAAAAELTQAAAPVCFERCIHVPEDETCFYVFEAPSVADVAEAARRAGLDPIRIVEAT
jgi:sirohydrochlorin ferrochelatase